MAVFESVQQCVASVEADFAQETTKLQVTSICNFANKETQTCLRVPFQHNKAVPRYLFRGEPGDSCAYPETKSSILRLASDPDLQTEIITLTSRIADWLSNPASNFHLTNDDAVGLIQHLGLPTHYLDFSSDATVAAAFAVGDKDPGQLVNMAVLDVCRAVNFGRLANLCDNPWSERARRQSAYGFWSSIDDLKSNEAIEKLSIRWMQCIVTEEDKAP